MSRQLFVYWKLEPAEVPAALAAVRQAQAALCAAWPGLEARVYRRCDPAPQATVMETYAAPGGIDDAGAHRIEAALAGIAPGARHVEGFSPA